jgi:thiol-disulfide isomerase/thioredoxin
MRWQCAAAAAAAMTLGSWAMAQPSLGPGSKAPALTIAKWYKGTPVTKFEPGKVYVVEFWATWCGPCRVSIPHITELARKFSGKVTFAGISVWERDPAYIEKVGKFVEEMGSKMEYNVGADDADGTTAKAWMTAAGEGGIPSAFIVDGQGKIAWIGHPMADMEATLTKVLSGTWNMGAYKAARAKEKAAEEAQMRLNRQIGPLMQQRKYAEALKILDSAIAKDKSLEKGYAMGRFTILAKVDEARAQSYALSVAKRFYRDQPMYLNQFAWSIVADDTQLKKPDAAIGLQIADMAAAASKHKDPDILDTLAMAQFRAGKTAVAAKTQATAVALAKKAGRPAPIVADMEKRLATFKKAAK